MVGLSDIECEDSLQTTHRLERNAYLCSGEGGESILWYILLILPMCLFFVGVSIIVPLTFKPQMLQKSIKKKCLKPTSYWYFIHPGQNHFLYGELL